MNKFYYDMKSYIIVYSNLNNNKKLLTEAEIKSLQPYKDASDECKEDFDSSIIGGMSKAVSKSKVKKLSSPYSSGYVDEEANDAQEDLRLQNQNTDNTVPFKDNIELAIDNEKNSSVFIPHYNVEKYQSPQSQQRPSINNVALFEKPVLDKDMLNKEASSETVYYYNPTEVDPIEKFIA